MISENCKIRRSKRVNPYVRTYRGTFKLSFYSWTNIAITGNQGKFVDHLSNLVSFSWNLTENCTFTEEKN